jgi:hypothetical protein
MFLSDQLARSFNIFVEERQFFRNVSHVTGCGNCSWNSGDMPWFSPERCSTKESMHFLMCYSCRHKTQTCMVIWHWDCRRCETPRKFQLKEQVSRRGQWPEETLHESVKRAERQRQNDSVRFLRELQLRTLARWTILSKQTKTKTTGQVYWAIRGCRISIWQTDCSTAQSQFFAPARNSGLRLASFIPEVSFRQAEWLSLSGAQGVKRGEISIFFKWWKQFQKKTISWTSFKAYLMLTNPAFS